MIVLDTNVVSEVIRSDPSLAVIGWLDRQPSNSLYLTATSLAELLVGIAYLPPGRRRTSLHKDVIELVDALFGDRVLPFDGQAAVKYADIVSTARSQGRTILVADGQIAAIASAREFAVATRDMAPFHAAGVEVINPWKTT
jgi:predicted nucleic acid-binding protein